MKILHKCDLCESEKLKVLYKVEDCNRGFEGVFNLYKCENCGLMFLNPQPAFKELKKYYGVEGCSKEYYSYNHIKKGGFWIKFMRKLYTLYVKHPFILRTFLFPLSSFVRGIKIVPCGRYLDVGCGGGQFLYEMKRLNPTGEYYGVEPGNFDEKDVKKYDLKIFKGELKEARYPDNYFNVITMNHVFEHVSDPSKTIKEFKRKLKPDGTLIIAVPNHRSLVYKLFGKYWYHLDAPRHLFTYSEETLKKYANKFYFKIEKIRYGSRADSISFIFSGIYYFNGLTGSKHPLKSIRMQKENSFIMAIYNLLHFLLIPLTTLINFLNFGDTIEIWLKNKD